MTVSVFTKLLLPILSAAGWREKLEVVGTADYTAADVLAKLLTVDGAGSGLDADLLDGLEGAAYAKISGGAGAAFTDSISVNKTSATATVTISASAGQLRLLGFQTAGSNRWYLGADNVAESGSNVGSDFGIFRYADNGAFLGNPVVINRANGNVGLANNLGVSGTIDGTTGVYDGGVRVARTNAAQTFSARQDIAPGGTNICLVATRGGDTAPHLYIDMNSSANTGDQFVRFVSAGTTSGTITANGASNVAYNTSSDPRLKKDLELLDLAESVERIKALRLWKGKWKIDGSPFRGILTTELQHVIPEAVTGPEDGIEEEWVVGSEEQPRRIIRKPDEDGFAKIEAKAPEDADLHPLGEQIAPQMWDPGKAMPDVMGALQWALGRIDQLEARIAALESA